MPFIPGTKIKLVGGEFNTIEGDYRVIDHSRHETNIDSNNMYDNKLTDSYNNNSKKFSGQSSRPRAARDDGRDKGMKWTPSTPADGYTRPSPQSQSIPRRISSGGGYIANDNVFNMKNNQISDSFNDNSQTHYSGRPPAANQRRRDRPQNLQPNSELFGSSQIKASEQIPKLPLYMENSVRPHIQHINERMRQVFSKTPGQTQPLSEGNHSQSAAAHQDEIHEDNDLHKPLPTSNSSSGPIFRTIKGDLTRYDTSVHQTNISSFNTERNTIKKSFNNNSLIDSSGK